MIYLKETITHHITIDKSEFIAIITPINSTDESSILLKSIKKSYPKATHYTTAYIFENTQGSSDDGEPSGTAGIPMLEVLNHHELNRVYAVVVRYFGGIKLGAGGLIRAYSKAVSECLKLGRFYKLEKRHLYEIAFSYDKINLIDQLFNTSITQKTYDETVRYTLMLENDDVLTQYAYLLKSIKNLGIQLIEIPRE